MKLKICLMGLLCLYFSANAQTKVAPTPLKIGDLIPDQHLNLIVNGVNKTAKLSDFRGKLVLLDFWDVWCGSCIKSFPEMDSLQHVFPDKLKILLMNQHDSEKAIRLLVARLDSWSIQKLKLPIVYGDTVIAGYFRFRSIPSVAWVGPDGHLLAFTEKDQVTAANIQKVINGEKIDLPFKDEFSAKADKPKPSKP